LKLLLLASSASKNNIEAVFRRLETSHNLHIEWLDGVRQNQLSTVMDRLSAIKYDRVLVWLPFKCLYTQIVALRKLPRLILFDASLNEYPSSEKEALKQRVKLCKALPWARFLVAGQKKQRWLKEQGMDVRWLPPLMAFPANSNADPLVQEENAENAGH